MLINRINLDKKNYIDKEARVSDYIDKTKNWNPQNLQGCLSE